MSVESLITQHIDIWTSAVQTKSTAGRGTSSKLDLYGIKKLRELILELAVRGKLVPQDPDDEPASVLLGRIEKEKELLVKNKTLKKQAKAKPILEEDKPYELPKNWSFVRLQDIISISSGKNLTASKMNDTGNIPVYGGNGITGYHNEFNVDKPTIVIGRVGFYCGSVHLTPDRAWVTDNAFITYYSEGNIGIDFLVWLLKATNLSENDNATAQPVISGRKVYPIIVGLPPLKEQHRIVAKVDELMKLCDQLEQQTEASIAAHQVLVETLLATLTNSKNAEELMENWQCISAHFDTLFTTEESIDQLKQTILQLAVMGKLVPQNPADEPASKLLERIAKEKAQLVKDKKIKKQKALPPIADDEKPFELPDGWEWVKFQDLCFKITDGEHSTPKRSESGYYLLSARNVTNEGILLKDVDYVPESEFQRIRNRCDPNIGDILISCSGSVGRVALVDKNDAYSMVRSAAMIRPCNVNLDCRYLSLLLQSPYLQHQMKQRSKQSAQANLFLGAISNLVGVIPPLAEQIKIVYMVERLFCLSGQLQLELNAGKQTQFKLTNAMIEKVL